jgi:hypothetical protein
MGNFNVDVDAVQQRAADLLLVASDGHGRTTAFFHRVAVEAAGAPVQVAVVDIISPTCWISFMSPGSVDAIALEPIAL